MASCCIHQMAGEGILWQNWPRHKPTVIRGVDQCFLLSTTKHLVPCVRLPFHLVWFLKTPDDAISFLKEVILSLLVLCGQPDPVPTPSLSAVQEKTGDILSSSFTLDEPHTLHSEHRANSSVMIWPPHHRAGSSTPQLPVDTGSSLVLTMTPAHLHPTERMPTHRASP